MPPTSDSVSWRIALPHTAAAVPMARALIRTAWAELTTAADGDTVELLTAELVANAVERTHRECPLTLVLELLPLGCQVEVHHGDPTPTGGPPGPAGLAADPWQLDGRGLLLVRALSSAHGERETHQGRALWFTLPNRS